MYKRTHSSVVLTTESTSPAPGFSYRTKALCATARSSGLAGAASKRLNSVETAAATSARMAVARERTKWLANVLMAVMPQTNIKQKNNDTKTKRTNTHKEHINQQNEKNCFRKAFIFTFWL